MATGTAAGVPPRFNALPGRVLTWASDHMLRLRSSCTLTWASELSSFMGSPAGSNTRTSAPSLVRTLGSSRQNVSISEIDASLLGLNVTVRVIQASTVILFRALGAGLPSSALSALAEYGDAGIVRDRQAHRRWGLYRLNS